MSAVRIQTSDKNSIINSIKFYYWFMIFMIWVTFWRQNLDVACKEKRESRMTPVFWLEQLVDGIAI